MLDRFQGTLFAKVLLGRVEPVALDEGVVRFGGKLDRLELQRVESSSRKGVEALLAEEFGVSLLVRFTPTTESAGSSASDTLADYASSLFGGQVVSDR